MSSQRLSHRLDGHCSHAVLHDLDREIVLIADLLGPVLTLLINANDVIDAATMPGNADDSGVRALHGFRRQQVREDPGVGTALEDEFFAAVSGKLAHFESLGFEGHAFGGKAADQLGSKKIDHGLGRQAPH